MGHAEIAKKLPWARGVTVLDCDQNGLLAIEKPAGVLSHPNKKGEKAKALLDAGYDEKRQAYSVLDTESGETRLVYLLNRLDSATSGIVLLALEEGTAKAALKAFETKNVRKTYQALVFGAPRGGPPLWRDRLSVKHAEGGVRASAGGGLSAETKLVKVELLPGVPLVSRLTLMPITGRTHQLRIQTSKRRIPIVGDRTYGDFQKNKMAAKKGMKRLCLHCVGTELQYQLSGRSFRFKASSKSPF
ncbi:RNA pseudouridine synthase family [Verrucomicrobiia bacterium DG1235]|nr:RNA pseudouridine synthase family [Verrucomicrobiae bacterium DG1235]